MKKYCFMIMFSFKKSDPRIIFKNDLFSKNNVQLY